MGKRFLKNLAPSKTLYLNKMLSKNDNLSSTTRNTKITIGKTVYIVINYNNILCQ